MKTLMTARTAVPTLALAALVACGGSSSSSGGASAPPAAAKGLTYANPASTGWRLEKDPSSTATHVVLNLVGPTGLKGRGVALTVHSDAAKMAWGRVGGAYIQDGGAFELAVDPTDPNEARLMVGGAKGSDLMVGAFQKDPNLSAKPLDTKLYSFAIDFKSDAKLAAGDTVPLSVIKARLLPEDLGPRRLQDITVAAGALKAN